MPFGEPRILGPDGLDGLIRLVAHRGWTPWGPVVRDGAVVPGRIRGLSDLPVGWHDEQDAGCYRLRHEGDDEVFGWAVGPASWKSVFYPASQTVWEGSDRDGTVALTTAPSEPSRPVALIGVRPCEVAGLRVLDTVLLHGAVADPGYSRRRRDALLIAAECSAPASTCFCSSMGSGPGAGEGPDLVLTELGCGPGQDHRFLLRAGTPRGGELADAVPGRPATDRDSADREALIQAAASRLRRSIDADEVPVLLARSIDHPRWEVVGDRCLACGNCTLVCPTCFCSDVRDTSDLVGGLTRTRVWASCFDLDHSYIHGGPVRRSRSSRYRQWLTHKLSTWHAQFGSSGCVGCGRCITWCPVGIDLTAEVAAIADGARREP
ncbi:MAG TPA: 4Fe-4S dicluster domain-containing protein [Acidimicrobiales bacterium]|nr:4Fe-4S dicluster domain-containing protein [Acidimicrobiales bacterium]